MRGLVAETNKLTLTQNNNNNNTNNIINKNKLINNTKVNNNNNMASSALAKNTTSTGVTNATISNTMTTTTGALRKSKARPKSTDCKMLQQPTNKQKQQPQQQQQRPKSSIITGSPCNLNNNNNTNNKSKNGQNQAATTISLPKASHANTNEDISGGVQDTIYLCNFRVSVDGEWLCLKELQDLDCNHSSQSPANATNNTTRQASYAAWQKNKRYSGISSQGDENARDPAEIERSNLVNICKLVVKELLEQSLRYGRMLDSDHLPLQHFFIVIEHVLGHGLRTRKGLLGPRKELWDLLQSVENYCPEAVDITASVRDLPTVRTHIGRARAWLRIALMQKKLSDYLQALIEHRDEALFEYYEPHALMLSDEIVIIMGILVGLNVIDCNLCVKEEDLDSQQGVIDFSLYLRSSSRNNDSNEEVETEPTTDANGQGNMIAVLDQKNYIEELNRHLNATVTNLQAKVESLTTTNALMKEDLAIARNSLLALQAENQAMRGSAGPASMNSTNSDQSSHSNPKEEKEAMVILTAELADLKKRNTELEKELKLQVSLKAESDMAMKLLEKDIHEKQDTIVSLRRQLDDIKQINLDMYRKLQDCESSLAHKTELLAKLESQKEDMSATITQLEKKWSDEKSNLSEILKTTTHNSTLQLTSLEERAARAETEARIEREWRASLQSKEKKLKDNISDLQNCIKELQASTQNNDKLRQELDKVKTQWSEAQTTLEELGVQLSVSKLKVNELQEREKRQLQKQQLQQQQQQPQSPLQTSMEAPSIGIWAPDSIVSHCTSCRKEFNLTRRKHHCRSCGDIFCKSCSEHTLPLLNEQGQLGKPVRVCDNCYATKM